MSEPTTTPPKTLPVLVSASEAKKLPGFSVGVKDIISK
jgi:hypothetical protein